MMLQLLHSTVGNYVDEQIDVDNVCYSYFECSLHVLMK